MKKKRESIDFTNQLNSKRVPIVILDERWHKLFEKQSKTPRVLDLEKKLNELMKQQGRLITDVKDLKAAKHQLMDGIVANMQVDSSPDGKLNNKKLQKSQKLIQDINSKLKDADDQLSEMPYRIKEVNSRLVVEGMNVCYQKMDENTDELKQMDEKIMAMREELKRLIGLKQDKEEENSTIYSYMHDVLGSDIMETLDRHYRK